MKALWSLLRHCIGAALVAGGVVLGTSADLTLKVILFAVGGAVLPVLGSAVNPKDPRFGIGAETPTVYTEQDAVNHLKD